MTNGNGKVAPVLGTMTFGVEGQVKYEGVVEQLKAFIEAGYTQIDTARVYQMLTPDGDTETLLGKAFSAHPELKAKASIATKVNAAMPPLKSLSRESVMQQCETSLQKLGMGSVDILYLHMPDIHTPIDDTLSGIAELHRQGKFKEFGLSNFPAWKVVDIFHRCRARGMVLPTVYQGMYNIITRDMERELVPVCREFGMRLIMYNPLAGGLLTGRYTNLESLQNATSGRFSAEFGRTYKLYKARYGKQQLFEAISLLTEACKKAEISMDDAALRWVMYHSCLDATCGDGVIFGVSRMEHLQSNIASWQHGPLPKELVEACDAAWALAAPACESYFRNYGDKPGGIDGFLKKFHEGNLPDEAPEAKRRRLQARL
eukprot:gnl/MRDRNA2_/MRDRNA2_71459_c0_seq1.p1 gnl/MRDRNA2_/MRDRNA2_71459_c0~~gnl/MRDRNA2_/MRDRNA2_71459_c0_seq1.p1  ORF type:complete len:397 (+),score=78.99 gnl/MRDRNA2_/MRDRNA2_71459_c0_seq1:74-1192(+)